MSFLIELYLDNKLLQEYNICGDKMENYDEVEQNVEQLEDELEEVEEELEQKEEGFL